MTPSDHDSSEHLTDALEREIARANDLPPDEGRAVIEALKLRHPQHIALIEALSGVLGFARRVEAEAKPDSIGTYRIERELGQGGMGRVYLAHRTDDGLEVALKVIRPDFDSEQLLRRFQREAKVLESLRHDGIARFIEAGDSTIQYADGRTTTSPFLAMEFVDGLELLAFVRTHGLDLTRRVDLAARVCAALGYAHGLGVVHRDIKPANILVAQYDDGSIHPKLLDFGIARADHAETGVTMALTLTDQRSVIGTAPYMSPEQVRGSTHELDARADVYSMGVVLYELLTGRLPYAIESTALPEIARIISEVEPTRLGTHDASLRGSPLEIIVGKALEKQPARRYANGSEFADDLSRYLSSHSIRARPVSRWRRTLRFARRHRVVTATMIALLVGLLVATWFAVREQRASALASRIAYGASISAASAAASRHDAATMKRVLDLAPTRWRNWEWRHLRGRVDNALAHGAIPRAKGSQYGIAFGADGEVLATRSDTDSVTHAFRLEVDGETRALARQSLGETEGCRYMFLVPYRSRAVGFRPGFTTWDLSGPTHTPIGSAARIHDVGLAGGLALGITTAGELHVLDLDGQHVARELLRGWVPRSLGITGNWERRWLVGLYENAARFWMLGEEGEGTDLPRHRSQRPRTIAASPDGRWLAIGGEDGTLGLWTIEDGGPPRLLHEMLGHTDAVLSLAFSPDGERLASGGEDNSVRVWRIGSSSAESVHSGHERAIRAVSFDADSSRLASVDALGRVRVWPADPDPRILRHPGPIEALEADDGIVYTGCADGHIRLFDSESSEPITTWTGPWHERRIHDLAICGKRLAVATRQSGIYILDADSGAMLRTLEGCERQSWGVAVSPDGQRLVGRTRQGPVVLWSVETGRVIARTELDGTARSHIAFSRDGRDVLVGLPSGRIQVLAASDLTPTRVFSAHAARVVNITSNRAGDLLCSGAGDGSVRVLDRSSGATRFELSGHRAAVLCSAFSPDGSRIATGGHDRTVRIWDAHHGTQITSLAGHRDFVAAMRFLPSGRLITASGDWSVRIWDDVTLAERIRNRRTYREFADRFDQEIAALAAEADPPRALERLARRYSWSPRQRQIARQRLMRARQ